ncbi:hypothetical protein CEP52_017282 [Fusarium oligoseptatum]|uniref:PD-(D/E)XK nuclease-like domain-containing protein n=1 Tax=Fusarium oligoseptatum TaxID=2604345 RepID=A0A428RU70_9HYPO|nr:hypothetical protein CEP52_017282 [Fusarium oligoseptatum]
MDFPVVHVALGNSPLEILPQEVHDLFQSVHDIPMDHESFIPFEIKDFIKATVFGAKDRRFMPPLQPSSTNDTEGGRWTGVPMSPTGIAIAELDTLRDIEAKAGDCELRGCAEFTWNSRVHDPLLLHALSGHRAIHVEPSQVARIATQFIPSTGGRGGGHIIESKMIDYCLTLRFNQGMPDQSLEDTPSSDARLMDAISRRVWAQPSDSQTFNQTLYDPLQFCPIACSIEAKSAASNGDGKLQLSVWVAAWYKRMQKLLPDGSPMVTLPLIRVMGHGWILLFAVHRGHRIEIIGEHEIGNTSTLMGIYVVNSVLRKIADWIDTSYRGWLEHVLLG